MHNIYIYMIYILIQATDSSSPFFFYFQFSAVHLYFPFLFLGYSPPPSHDLCLFFESTPCFGCATENRWFPKGLLCTE